MRNIIIILMFFFAFLVSCSGDKTSDLKPLDLMSYGIPLKVKAPAGTTVKVEDLGIMKDITLKKDKNYFVQIISTSATTNDVVKLKEERLNEVKKNPFFSKVILMEDSGFVFEKKLSDSTFNYDFRHIKIQGDNEFSFQTGLYGIFDKEQVMSMYESVK